MPAMGCEICLQFEFEKFSIALRSGALKISKYIIYKFATHLNAKYFTAMGCEICLQFEFEKFSIALRRGTDPVRRCEKTKLKVNAHIYTCVIV